MAKTVLLRTLISPAPLIRCGNNTFPVLSMTMHDGIVLQSDRFKKNLASLDQSNYKVVQRGQLVVGFPIDEGVLYIQSIADSGIMSPAYNVWNVDVDKVSPRFLELSLHNPVAMQYYKDNLRGTTARRRSIPSEVLLALPLVLPPMEEQLRIVSALDKLTFLISLRKQQLAKLDELVKARFVEMFGDPVHNTKMLPIKSLADLGSLDRGKSKHRPRNAPELLGGPYPLIQTGEVANAGLYIASYQNTYSELGLQQSKMWNAGTLCITIAANIAQTAILAIDACFPDSVVGFVPNKEITSVYMHYWFGFFQKILEEQAPQVAQKNINLQILSDLKVMVPSMENQQEFLLFVERIEKSKLTIQQSLDKMEVLKKSLMQEYFG